MKQIKPPFVHILILICFLLFIAIGGWHKIVQNFVAVLSVLVFLFYKHYISKARVHSSEKTLKKKRLRIIFLLIVTMWGFLAASYVVIHKLVFENLAWDSLLLSLGSAILFVSIPVIIAEYVSTREQKNMST